MKYYLLNVFTKDAKAGNQLAVVLTEQVLTPEKMQSIAREFNFSETVFITNPSSNASARIFTPKMELPFAGHPTVGASWLLHQLGMKNKSFTLEVPQGTLQVSATPDSASVIYPGDVQIRPIDHSIHDYIGLCNISDDDIQEDEVLLAKAGPEFTMIPVKSRKALSQARTPVASGTQVRGYFFYRESSSVYHVRMFSMSLGIGEDAATGSAACALAGYLKYRGTATGEVTVLQGKELNRECQINLKWSEQIEISGNVKLWAKGCLVE